MRQVTAALYRYSHSYTTLFKASEEDPAGYWLREAKNTSWDTFPRTAFTTPQPHFYQWFPSGRLNIVTNCLDRHLADYSNDTAYFMESPITRSSTSITYGQLAKRVEAFAHALKRSFAIKKHDRVIVYMPMIIESVIAMLACARIGAPHVCVFGGFSAQELANRISDSNPSLVICANAGIEPNKVIDYRQIVNQALNLVKANHIPKIVCYRPLLPNISLHHNEFDFHEVERSGEKCAVEILDSTDPLYILYTSGTTGRPKGIVRDHGGTAVLLQHAMRLIYNASPLDTMFCSSDIGWVLGHSFIIYGPLLAAMRSVLFEGKPNCTPDASVFWDICQRNKVKYLYTSPTAIRTIRKEDPEGKQISSKDLSLLKIVSMVGERCDIETFNWVASHFKNQLVIDNYWQTQTGGPILSNFTGTTTFPPKAGSAGKPLPGYQLSVRKENGQPCVVNETGIMFLREPMPPSFMMTILNGEDKYIEKYFSTVDGYYNTGDSGYYDEDGYFYVMSRIDDVINTAGHRLSTGEMEQVLMKHPKIAEAVVIGVKDELKGEVPVGFVTLKNGAVEDPHHLQREAVRLIRQHIGPVASFKTCHLVHRLPKTRSGKYLRNIIRKIINHEKYEIPSTVQDTDVIIEIQAFIKNLHK